MALSPQCTVQFMEICRRSTCGCEQTYWHEINTNSILNCGSYSIYYFNCGLVCTCLDEYIYSNFINCGRAANTKNTKQLMMKNDTNLAHPVIVKKQCEVVFLSAVITAIVTLWSFCAAIIGKDRSDIHKWRFYNYLSCPFELSPKNVNGLHENQVISWFTGCYISIWSPLFRTMVYRGGGVYVWVLP